MFLSKGATSDEGVRDRATGACSTSLGQRQRFIVKSRATPKKYAKKIL
jgi:hypothetical protein